MTAEQQRSRWQQFHIFQAKMEKKWRPAVTRAIRAQVNQFIAYADVNGYDQAVAMIDTVVKFDGIAKVVQSIYRDTGVKWGFMTYRELNRLKRISNGIQSELLDFIDQYFQMYILSKSTIPITETTKDWIREQITQGIADGKSYEQIAASMESSDMPKVRSLTIVRTETVRAANVGAVEGARKTGLMLRKIWISAKDNRTRRLPRDNADHLNMDSQKVEMDGSFAVQTKKHGVVQMAQPGDASAPAECTVNCRCCAGFEPIRDQQGRLVRAAA